MGDTKAGIRIAKQESMKKNQFGNEDMKISIDETNSRLPGVQEVKDGLKDILII